MRPWLGNDRAALCICMGVDLSTHLASLCLSWEGLSWPLGHQYLVKSTAVKARGNLLQIIEASEGQLHGFFL